MTEPDKQSTTTDGGRAIQPLTSPLSTDQIRQARWNAVLVHPQAGATNPDKLTERQRIRLGQHMPWARLLPASCFSKVYASEYINRAEAGLDHKSGPWRVEDPTHTGPRSQTVAGIINSRRAGASDRPTAESVYQALKADNPTAKQRRHARVLTEGSYREIFDAWTEEAFTWHDLADLLHWYGWTVGELQWHMNLYADHPAGCACLTESASSGLNTGTK